MSAQVAKTGSVISVTPVEPYQVTLVASGELAGSVRSMWVVAHGIAVSDRDTWVVTTYATLLVMSTDGTLMPIRQAMADCEEVHGGVC